MFSFSFSIPCPFVKSCLYCQFAINQSDFGAYHIMSESDNNVPENSPTQF